MAKLTPVKFHHYPTTGQPVKFESDVRVDSSGYFSFSVPDEIHEHAKQVFERDHYSERAKVKTDRVRRGGRQAPFVGVVCGRDMKEVHKFIERVIEDFAKVETTEELFIAYRYASGMQYWIAKAGTIYPNGSYDEKEEQGSWQYSGDRMGSSIGREDKGLRIQASVVIKLTHKRGDETTTEFMTWKKDEEDKADPRRILNDFDLGDYDEDDKHWRLIPYTPQACQYFCDIVVSLCKIDLQLTKFFDSPKAVDKAIVSGVMPALK